MSASSPRLVAFFKFISKLAVGSREAGTDPKDAFRYAWQPYVVAVALIAVAAALRVWPLQALGSRLAWLTFYPAVMIVTLNGGLTAGLLGTFLACLTVLYILPELVDQPFIKDSIDWLGMVVFFITCTMISVVAEAMRRARDREKQAKAQLEAVNNELEDANKELEAFSYSVSHDLRAPLRHIAGFVATLQKDAAPMLDEKNRRYLTTIADAARRMGTLIDDLLTFSRVGRAEMQKTAVSLEQLIQEAQRDLAVETHARDIRWKIRSLPVVYGDRSLLRLVLINLISNAVKFTRTRAQAEIEIGRGVAEEDENVVFVRDNGVGFDMKYVEKLFSVFQRLHRTDEFEGTGIGLANVQRIIRRHGGRTWAESSVDGGATFYFSLPKM